VSVHSLGLACPHSVAPDATFCSVPTILIFITLIILPSIACCGGGHRSNSSNGSLAPLALMPATCCLRCLPIIAITIAILELCINRCGAGSALGRLVARGRSARCPLSFVTVLSVVAQEVDDAVVV